MKKSRLFILDMIKISYSVNNQVIQPNIIIRPIRVYDIFPFCIFLDILLTIFFEVICKLKFQQFRMMLIQIIVYIRNQMFLTIFSQIFLTVCISPLKAMLGSRIIRYYKHTYFLQQYLLILSVIFTDTPSR